MNNKPYMVSQPAFAVPLKPDQLLLLGYIAVTWGQIDFFLDILIIKAYRLQPKQKKSLIGDQKPVGAKIKLLRDAIEDLPPEAQDDARKFLVALDAAKQARNHAFHGIWGLMWERSKVGQTTPAAHYEPHPKAVFTADQLPQLQADLAETSRLGDRAVSAALKINRMDAPLVFYFLKGGADGKRPPSWLQGPDAKWKSRRLVPRRK